MAGSTTILDTIATAQAQKEVTANALFDAGSPAVLFGRRASTCAALTWGYYGGAIFVAGTSESLVQIPNGTVSLTASDTNYVEADADGVVTANLVGFTPGATALYEIVTGAAAVTSYTDWRISVIGAAGGVDSVNGAAGVVVLDAADIDITDAGLYYTGTNVEAALQEIGADLAGMSGGGTVTSVAASVPAFLSVAGSPVTTAGTLAITYSGTALPVANGGTGNTNGSAATLTTPRTIGGVSFDGSANITQPFDVHVFYPGIPTASAILLRGPVARAVGFVANLVGSHGTASAAATGSTAFDITKNGTTIGTATFAAAATTATFTTAGGSAQTLAAGDVLAIIAPVTPDATLANVGFVLAGTR